eukprot:3664998-Prymnesium_polylepis.1
MWKIVKTRAACRKAIGSIAFQWQVLSVRLAMHIRRVLKGVRDSRPAAANSAAAGTDAVGASASSPAEGRGANWLYAFCRSNA